ncbi:MAG: hypothetical protein JNK05_15085 [Myxococcales bacterium]|nr:hypothetical protein [Myxococcales bacterium]
MNRSVLAILFTALIGCGGGAATTGGTTGGTTAATTGGTSGGSSGGSGATASNVTIRNSSNWTIMRLFMSPTSQDTWGPDQLGANVIATGASFTLTNIPCNNYDVKIVDSDNDECILRNVNVCESESVNITSDALLACQSATRANGAANKSVSR